MLAAATGRSSQRRNTRSGVAAELALDDARRRASVPSARRRPAATASACWASSGRPSAMKLTSWPTFISTPFISPSSLATSSAVRMANWVSSSARRSAGVTMRRARVPAKRVGVARRHPPHPPRAPRQHFSTTLRPAAATSAPSPSPPAATATARPRFTTPEARRRARTAVASSSSAASTSARSAAMASRSGSVGGGGPGSTAARLAAGVRRSGPSECVVRRWPARALRCAEHCVGHRGCRGRRLLSGRWRRDRGSAGATCRRGC